MKLFVLWDLRKSWGREAALRPTAHLGPRNNSCPPAPYSSGQSCRQEAGQRTHMAHSWTEMHHSIAACE